MSLEYIIFLFFKFIIIVSAIMVVTSKNPIHSVLFLILVFCSSAGLLLLLGAEFLAMVFVVVYVGAIAVLFLFVVMMLNIRMIELNESFLLYFPFSALVAFILIIQFGYLFFDNGASLLSSFTYVNWFAESYSLFNIEVLGLVLYTHYFISFVLAGLILLVAMIGSIVLTLTHRLNVKRQQIYSQLLRMETSVRLIN